MALGTPPLRSVRSSGAMVASADHLATQAGVVTIARGGNAVDAAIAANAAIAVTAPHLCGLGGDLYALVHAGGAVHALNASGRAGIASDASALRAEGHLAVPLHHDVRAVTVPGCVDGWCALHDRFGSLPLEQVLAPAVALADNGFPASPLLVASLATLDNAARPAFAELISQATDPGRRVRRPGIARTLRAIAEGGRDAFYGGEFGEGLRALGAGLFAGEDLARSSAEWVAALTTQVWDHGLHTLGPNSQGYLLLGAARIAEQLALPPDPDDPMWAHLLIEASSAAGHDRPLRLHEVADGPQLVEEIAGRVAVIDPQRAAVRVVPVALGDTTYLCSVDGRGTAVSLIQSNAGGFGSWLIEPNTGINLHNRGLGFSLVAGHPAELAPGRRPPHTLCPAMATRADGSLAAVFGTMGGDGQPQILLQIAARLFAHHESPAHAIHSGRWVLRGPATGFDTWTAEEGPTVQVEGHAPPGWADALAARGHRAERTAAYDSTFGHAHAIVIGDEEVLVAAADPRSIIGSAAGL